MNYKRYLLYNLFIYSFIIFITSFISLFILNINLSLLPLMTFQFSVNSIIFLIATRFRKTFTYYAFAIGSTLLRSEERRVGKECRYLCVWYHETIISI